MRIMHTLLLAGCALSIGAAAANAQMVTPGSGGSGYYSSQSQAAPVSNGMSVTTDRMVQYGGTDQMPNTFVPYSNSNLTQGGF